MQDLEQAGSFVVSLDTERTWFRYHQMFGELLQLELRRAARARSPGCTPPPPSGWPPTSTRRRRSATPRRPGMGSGHPPARRPVDRPFTWTGRLLSSTSSSPGSLPGLAAADAGLAVVAAADELTRGIAGGGGAVSGPGRTRIAECASRARRGQTRLLLGVVRLLLARQRGDLSGSSRRRRAAALADAADTLQAGLHEDLRALALISVGSTLYWTARREEAESTWNAASRWPAGSGGPTWSSSALPTRRQHCPFPLLCAGGRSRQAGGGAGRAARLDR